MSNAFGHVPDLLELSITSEPQHNTIALKGKIKKRKDHKDEAALPPFLAQKLAEVDCDAAVVDIRDLRKFLRRMPHFRVVRWIGRGGKGEWRITSTKKSTLIPIDFVHSATLTKQIWLDCQREPPSFEFDDEVANTKALELPPSPDRHSPTELPTLSRTTTGSSTSLMTAATPPSSAPVIVRRSSGTNSMNNSTVLGIEWESLPSPTAPTAPWATRRASTSNVPPRRLSSTDEMKLEIRTGKLEMKTKDSGESQPRRSSTNSNSRTSRSPTKAGRQSSGSSTKTPSRSATNGSVNAPPSPQTPRHVPGSGSPKKASPPPLSPVKKPAASHHAADGWTTVGGETRGRK
jgi:hypothetical protein